jgi:predicted porin
LENLFMKKTLVALAVLAASGASFAQVTLTGEATWGYSARTTGGATATDASGFGVDTSELYFATSEDIGGGNSVKTSMGIGGADRGGYITGGGVQGMDFTIAVGGASTGTLKVGTTKGADYLSGGGSSASVVGSNIAFDDKVFSARTISDNLSYSLPVGPVTLAVSHREAASATLVDTAGPAVGLGAGTTGSGALGQRKDAITVKGTFSGLTFDANYSVYDNKGTTSTGVDDNSLYAAANYNFGVAKVGFGFENRKKTLGSVNDLYLAAAASFGAFDAGVEFASRKYSDEFAAAGTKTGWALTGKYNLSKRTALIARTSSWEPIVSAANRSTRTDMYIDVNF